MSHQLTVDARAAAERLDVYLAAALGQTRSAVGRLVRTGLVTVNAAAAKPSYAVQPGDRIAVADAPPVAATTVPVPELPVIYEDTDLLVVDKPAGLAVHAGSGHPGRATVVDFARTRTADPDPDRPGIVHRLDQDTSGLLIIAKTTAAKEALQAQFKAHAIQKAYTLLVVGRLEPAEAVIRLPLGRDPKHPLRQAVVAGGRDSTTRYQVVAAYPGYTLVRARPATGRTHQLRVHFASLGHPVAGDTTYGSPRRPLGLKRQFLHATALEFTGPSGQVIMLESALPTDLRAVLQHLKGQS